MLNETFSVIFKHCVGRRRLQPQKVVLEEITVLSTFVSEERTESGGVIWQLCHFLFGMQQRIHRVKVLPLPSLVALR